MRLLFISNILRIARRVTAGGIPLLDRLWRLQKVKFHRQYTLDILPLKSYDEPYGNEVLPQCVTYWNRLLS